MKNLLTAASFAVLLAVPALAQEMKNDPPAATAQPSTSTTVEKSTTTEYSGEISVSELLNENVVNAANETVGDVNDVLIDSKGKIAAVIVGVGGFLGMGEKDVALTFDQLQFAQDSGNNLVVTTNATKESLQAAPQYTKPKDRS